MRQTYIRRILKEKIPGKCVPVFDIIRSQCIKSNINDLRYVSISTLYIYAGKCQKNSKKSESICFKAVGL